MIIVECPNKAQHTPAPDGYIDWHHWAEEKAQTHVQVKCPGCGIWTIWVPVSESDVGGNGEPIAPTVTEITGYTVSRAVIVDDAWAALTRRNLAESLDLLDRRFAEMLGSRRGISSGTIGEDRSDGGDDDETRPRAGAPVQREGYDDHVGAPIDDAATRRGESEGEPGR